MSKKPERRKRILASWEPILGELQRTNENLAKRVRANLQSMPLSELEAIEKEAAEFNESTEPVTIEELERATIYYESVLRTVGQNNQ